ncbi:MAG: methyltransferase domain-containing protein [Magnetococcales bacterium]|nr:methyltransferase domain-containing protein [Magnetococcales bacterium]
MEKDSQRQIYWEKNIVPFSGFYHAGSEEAIDGPAWFRWLYSRLIFPIEKRYMRERHDMVKEYLSCHCREQVRLADIGFGSGIFTRVAIEAGARVWAVDFSKSAVEAASAAIPEQFRAQVEFVHGDIRQHPIPFSDVAIAIGLLTYIDDADTFFDHVLPHTKRILFNFINRDNLLNRLRRLIPMLDVRSLAYHKLDEIEGMLHERGFIIEYVKPLATGFMVSGMKTV